MENNRDEDKCLEDLHTGNANNLTPLRPASRQQGGNLRGKRRPVVRSNTGHIVWQADSEKFYFDEKTGKRRVCSWKIEGGGTLVIIDPSGQLIEAYKLRPGEKVEQMD